MWWWCRVVGGGSRRHMSRRSLSGAGGGAVGLRLILRISAAKKRRLTLHRSKTFLYLIQHAGLPGSFVAEG